MMLAPTIFPKLVASTSAGIGPVSRNSNRWASFFCVDFVGGDSMMFCNPVPSLSKSRATGDAAALAIAEILKRNDASVCQSYPVES